MNGYLVIYAPTVDIPVYEHDFIKPVIYTTKVTVVLIGETEQLDNDTALPRFILYAALDILEVARRDSTSTYLRTIHQYGEWMISAYISIGGYRYLLMHDTPLPSSKRDDESMHSSLKGFIRETHRAWVDLVVVNPYYRLADLASYGGHTGLVAAFPSSMGAFDVKVRLFAKKHSIY